MQAGDKRRIGLLGGTFDPIHFGHLFIAEEARVVCELDEVLFFPNNQPAHAQGKFASLEPEIRFDLVRYAIASNPHFQASRIEMDRPGKSYLHDTLVQLQREMGEGVELFFIMGADSMLDIMTWYRGAELFELCWFVVSSRPGYDLEKARENLTSSQNDRVTWLEVPGLHIASSELRQRIAARQTIRYLVPDAVISRMEELGLYKV